MRVLLVYPILKCVSVINYGLASISAVLKSNGHACELIQICNDEGFTNALNRINKLIEDYNPRLIGFSSMTQHYPRCLAIGKELKRKFNIPLVIGGIHCTMVPNDVVDDKIWDYVCVGEGELALLELVNQIEKGIDPTACPNMIICNSSSPVKSKIGHFTDLNAIPYLDYDLFDLRNFLRSQNGWMRILTSRGCPNRCSYCCNHKIVDRYREEAGIKSAKEYLRYHRIDRIMNEISTLKKRYPEIKVFNFDDDLFTLNKNRVIAFTKAYEKAGIDLPYVVNAHVQFFDEEIAWHLKKSGCIIVRFGVESGSEHIRRTILKRSMSNRTIKKVFSIAHNYGIHTQAFIMMGIPYETEENLFETIKLCAEIKMGRFRWSFLYPYVGTEIHELARKADLINAERVHRTHNYFDESCLDFGMKQNLLLDKLGKVFNWYVNAYTDWPSADSYKKLIDQVDEMDWHAWLKNRDSVKEIDASISEALLQQGIQHYSIQFSNVTGVHSEYIQCEREGVLRKRDRLFI